MDPWKRDAWRRSANEHAQQGAGRGFREGLRGFRGSGGGGGGRGVGCVFYPAVGSINEMVRRRTHGQHHPCLPWAGGRFKFWFWCRGQFLKLMADHEMRSNVHSLASLCTFRTILWAYCQRCCKWFTFWVVGADGVRRTMSCRPPHWPLFVWVSSLSKRRDCEEMIATAAHVTYAHLPLTWIHTNKLQTHTDKYTHKHTLRAAALASLWGLPVRQMDKPHFPPLSHTQTLGTGEQGHVCVCTGVKFYPSFIYLYIFSITTHSIPQKKKSVSRAESSEPCKHAEWARGASGG